MKDWNIFFTKLKLTVGYIVTQTVQHYSDIIFVNVTITTSIKQIKEVAYLSGFFLW